MEKLTVYGASDDLIEFEGIKGCDEFMAYGDIGIMGEFIVTGDGDQLRIIAIYDGCWSFAIAPVDEDIPLPSWPVKYSLNDRGYSTFMEIEVPDNSTLFRKASD